MSAETIQERVASSVDPAGRGGAGAASAPRLRFSPNLDGYFLPKTPIEQRLVGPAAVATISILIGGMIVSIMSTLMSFNDMVR